ncbi:MAG: hypothetical protein SFY80_15985 [Verrucomicrobiota bacterium]|nr:hypothetical protein [Verrucomicrobiota bacterium]
MKQIVITLVFILMVFSQAMAGSQQTFFSTTVTRANKVTIVRNGPDKTLGGKVKHHTLLNTTDRTMIKELIAMIEMEDPHTEISDTGEEVWKPKSIYLWDARLYNDFLSGR